MGVVPHPPTSPTLPYLVESQEFKFGPFVRFPAVVEIFHPPASLVAPVELKGLQVLRKIIAKGKDNHLLCNPAKYNTPEGEKGLKKLCANVLRELAMERKTTTEVPSCPSFFSWAGSCCCSA